MSRYLFITFKFVFWISINVLIALSESSDQSFQMYGSNDSLVLNKNVASNSYYYFQNGLLVTNLTNINYRSSERYYDSCSSDANCDINYQKCCNNKCKNKYPSYECKAGYGNKCNKTEDCDTSSNLECKFKPYEYNPILEYQCLCKSGYVYSQGNCVANSYSSNDSNTAMQIYKITMIFASCCLALILIIFLVCILRKSYCPSQRQMVPLDNTIPDIFTLFPHVGNYEGGPLGDGTQPPFEKPPTYDETIKLMREEIGVPPPAYRSNHSPNSTNPSTPEMSSRVVITRPALITADDTNSHSGSSTHSTDPLSDISVAGPSGYRGYVNQAFSI